MQKERDFDKTNIWSIFYIFMFSGKKSEIKTIIPSKRVENFLDRRFYLCELYFYIVLQNNSQKNILKHLK